MRTQSIQFRKIDLGGTAERLRQQCSFEPASKIDVEFEAYVVVTDQSERRSWWTDFSCIEGRALLTEDVQQWHPTLPKEGPVSVRV